MTKRLLTVLVSAALAVAIPAVAADKKLGKSDREFLTEAASGGLMEVELGQVATKNAASDRVKQFGQRMVDDHSKANTELKQVASQESVTVPDSLTPKQRDQVARLSKLHGAEFDREYMKAMLQDHEEDVPKFRKEASSASDPKVKDFAAKTLPTLESHLDMAKSINAEISGRPTSGTPRSEH